MRVRLRAVSLKTGMGRQCAYAAVSEDRARWPFWRCVWRLVHSIRAVG